MKTDSEDQVAGDVPAAVKPKAKHTRERSGTFTLEYPVEYDGKVYTTITVSRLTGTQLQAFFDDERKDKRLPIFDVPDEVLAELDADDDLKLQAFAAPFLPRLLSGDQAKKSLPSPDSTATT